MNSKSSLTITWLIGSIALLAVPNGVLSILNNKDLVSDSDFRFWSAITYMAFFYCFLMYMRNKHYLSRRWTISLLVASSVAFSAGLLVPYFSFVFVVSWLLILAIPLLLNGSVPSQDI